MRTREPTVPGWVHLLYQIAWLLAGLSGSQRDHKDTDNFYLLERRFPNQVLGYCQLIHGVAVPSRVLYK